MSRKYSKAKRRALIAMLEQRRFAPYSFVVSDLAKHAMNEADRRALLQLFAGP